MHQSLFVKADGVSKGEAFLCRRVNASGRVDKNRGKIETVRPFEPSSTVVHPCTSVEGEFCARTKHRYYMELLPSLAVLVE